MIKDATVSKVILSDSFWNKWFILHLFDIYLNMLFKPHCIKFITNKILLYHKIRFSLDLLTDLLTKQSVIPNLVRNLLIIKCQLELATKFQAAIAKNLLAVDLLSVSGYFAVDSIWLRNRLFDLADIEQRWSVSTTSSGWWLCYWLMLYIKNSP